MGPSLLKEESPHDQCQRKELPDLHRGGTGRRFRTEWMAAGEGQVRYGEGREVEINTLNTTGLGDYDSTKTDGSAYPAGAVTSKWTGHTLAMDRGVKFALDHSATEDVTFPVTVENVIREFAKTPLACEQDAYRIHRLYTLASQGEHAALLFESLTGEVLA